MESALAPQRRNAADPASNPYQGRWRWWYASIADWMLDNPGGTMMDCAKAIGRGHSTVSMIVLTDLFKAHLALRRKEWEARHDRVLATKLQLVANKSLDLVVEVLDSKRDKVPLQQLQSIAEGALDRLGYGVQAKNGVTINNNVVAANIRPQVTLEELEAARQSYRAIQEKNRTIEHQPAMPTEAHSTALERLPYDPLALTDS